MVGQQYIFKILDGFASAACASPVLELQNEPMTNNYDKNNGNKQRHGRTQDPAASDKLSRYLNRCMDPLESEAKKERKTWGKNKSQLM